MLKVGHFLISSVRTKEHRWATPPHRLQNPKWPPVGPKMADGVFGHSKQHSLNKFFDPSTPSMRKVDDGEEKKKKRNKLGLSCAKLPLAEDTYSAS